MEIKLRKIENEKEKYITYVAPFISARMLRKTMEITKKLENGVYTADGLDELMDYIVEVFGNQFTRDDLYDGIASNEIITTAIKCISAVNGQLNEKVDELNKVNEKN